jgi:hypothetical protein
MKYIIPYGSVVIIEDAESCERVIIHDESRFTLQTHYY